MAVSKHTFGKVMHADLLGAKPGFVVPAQLDSSILHPAADTHFLSDEVKIALGIPLTHRPRMAIVDDALFKEYLARMVESATKLEELMAAYEELENSTPGLNRERLHATVQQSVQLISHVKLVPVHVALDGVGRWLKRQAYELERTQSELDTFDDTEMCISQADEENAEQKTQAHNDPEVVLRQGRASSYMHGGGGRPRLVGAVKRLQTGITAQEHMATGTTNETAATKGSSAMAAALSASAAAKSPNDSAGTEDAVDLEPIGMSTAPLRVASGLAGQTGKGVPISANPATGVLPNGGISPRGNKQVQEGASGGVAATCDPSVPELMELRGTVVKQSQQLEQLGTRLKDFEAEAARSQSRAAHLEACLQREGISIPIDVTSPACATTPTSMPLTHAAYTEQLSQPGHTSGGADEHLSLKLQKPSIADVQPTTSAKAGTPGGGQAVKDGSSGKSRAATQGQATPVQAASKLKQNKAQHPDGAKAKGSRSAQEPRSKGGPGKSTEGNMPQSHAGQNGLEGAIAIEESSPQGGYSSGDEDKPEFVTDPHSVEQASSYTRGAALPRKGKNSELCRKVSEMKKSLQEKDATISRMQKDIDEMSQALGAAIATVDSQGAERTAPTRPRPASQGASPARPAKAKRSNGGARLSVAQSKGTDELSRAVGIGNPIAENSGAERATSTPQTTFGAGPSRNYKIRDSYDHDAALMGEVSARGTTASDIVSSLSSGTGRQTARDNLTAVNGMATGEEGGGACGGGSVQGGDFDASGSFRLHTLTPDSFNRAPARRQTMQARVQDSATSPAAELDADAGTCPKCAELEKHLRYWRERDWFKKARDMKWEKLWARRREIPMNLSHFPGLLKIADELDNAGSMLGTRRSGGFGKPLSAHIPPSRKSLSRGHLSKGGLGDPEDQGLQIVHSLPAAAPDNVQQLPGPFSVLDHGHERISVESALESTNSTSAEGLTAMQHSSGAFAPVACGVTFDPARAAALGGERARPVRTLSSTATSMMAPPRHVLQTALEQIGLDPHASNEDPLLQGEVPEGPATWVPQEHPVAEPGRQVAQGAIATSAKNATRISHAPSMEISDRSPKSAIGLRDSSHPWQDEHTGHTGASVLVSDDPGSPVERQASQSPAPQRRSAAELGTAQDQSGTTPSVRNPLSQQIQAAHSAGQVNGAPLRARSSKVVFRRSVHAVAPDMTGSASDTRLEEQFNGVSQASSARSSDAGKLHSGQTCPLSDAGACQLEGPIVVNFGDASSSGRRGTSTGHKLAKPVIRERSMQKVDLASLKLQGTSANAASRRGRGGQDTNSDTVLKPRQTSSGGLSGRLRKTPKRIQHSAARQLRSFKLLGAGVKSANGSKDAIEE